MFGNARQPLIELEDMVLRPPRMSDWAEWAVVRADSRDFLKPWEPTWGEDALIKSVFRRRHKINARGLREGSIYPFFIFLTPGQALAGGINIVNVRRGVVQSGNLGYWMSARHAGNGIMGQALAAVKRFAFKELGLHRLEASCLPENEASIRLLLKCGFQEEGSVRQYLRIDGAWRDHLRFAVLTGDEG